MEFGAGQQKLVNPDLWEVVEFALVRVRAQGFYQCKVSEEIWIFIFPVLTCSSPGPVG